MKGRGSQARSIMLCARISTIMLSMAVVMVAIYIGGWYVFIGEFNRKYDISGGISFCFFLFVGHWSCHVAYCYKEW